MGNERLRYFVGKHKFLWSEIVCAYVLEENMHTCGETPRLVAVELLVYKVEYTIIQAHAYT